MRCPALVAAMLLLACPLHTRAQGLGTNDSAQQTCVSPPCPPYVALPSVSIPMGPSARVLAQERVTCEMGWVLALPTTCETVSGLKGVAGGV